MLKKLPLLALLLLSSGCASHPPGLAGNPTATSTPARARLDSATQGACFSLVSQGRKLPGDLKESTQCTFYVKALKQPCVVALTAYQGNGAQASPDMKPVVVALEAGSERQIPVTFAKGTPKTQVWVTVMAKDSAETLEVQELIRRWLENPQDAKPALATQTRLAEWWGRQDFQMSRSGQVPDELGGVSSTSAVSGHPSAPAQVTPKSNGPARAGSGITDEKDVNEASGGRQTYNWIAEADWAGCQPGRPEVFIYTITMR